MSWQEWFSLLQLSMMWQMSEIQQVAMGKILNSSLSKDEWTYMLKWSTSSRVSEVREKAIEKLRGSLQPLERVLLAKECQVSDWLKQGYKEIVERRDTIDEADEKKLGCKTTVKLFRLRDKRQHGGLYGAIGVE